MIKKILCSASLFCLACQESKHSDYSSDIVIGQRVYLQELPDSTFLQNLDSISGKEWVTGKKPSKVVKIGLGQSKVTPKMPSQAPKQPAKIKSVSPEVFAADFSQKVNLLSQDPSNKSIGKWVVVSQNGTIQQILSNEFGGLASQIPDAIIKYILPSLSPSVDLQNLQKGDRVLLPRM